MLLTTALVLILQQAPPATVPLADRMKAARSRDIVEVEASVSLIEEKELPLDNPRSEVEVPKQPSRGAQITDSTERGQRGMRLLAFTLSPKERLTVKQTGQDFEKIQLSLAAPAQQGPMSGEIGMVNKKPVYQRTRNLQIRNITDQPFTVLLKVTGFIGYPYKLDIQHEK